MPSPSQVEVEQREELLELQNALAIVRRYADEYGTLDRSSIKDAHELALHRTVINGVNHCCSVIEKAEYNHNLDKIMDNYGVTREEARMIEKYYGT